MKIEEIRSIVEMMSKHNLSEFKIESDDTRLSLKRGIPGATAVSFAPQPMIQMAAPQTVASAAAAIPVVAPAAPAPTAKQITIDAPIVGTFYSSASPDTPPFVKVGDKVAPDKVVCIIEAMKVMNEIKAEKEGIIKEILVKNAQSVEYGCPLFVIE
ncbi:MAG TPA: acetyl-CoA carboxylase biotin carboxyl carrier protein [Lentisphaeria bacterium]|nr:MAG: acetyl-CoA carboxylase, biotin carboxyl carrier protein [Lentisphaerae bacterium GWF2_38_69]HBM16463.1 acetyl-CoA carboxylase biotin carboxyl carrier protein [Lentisphaeria bacterium]